MEKALITSQKLIDVINLALDHDWKHKDCYCRVDSLKKVVIGERNWELSTHSTGGHDLCRTDECTSLIQRVLSELATKYNVSWQE